MPMAHKESDDPWNPLKWFFPSSSTIRHAEFLSHQADEAHTHGDFMQEMSCRIFSDLLREKGHEEQRRAAESFVKNFRDRN